MDITLGTVFLATVFVLAFIAVFAFVLPNSYDTSVFDSEDDKDETILTEGTTNDQAGTVGTRVSGQEEVQYDGVCGKDCTHD